MRAARPDVTRRERLDPRSRAGFSLLEVVAATAVLLIGSAAITGLYALAAGRTAGQGRAMKVRETCHTTAQTLLALPFRSVDGGADLVSAVFPHADPAGNTASARFLTGQEESAPAGSFVSILDEEGGQKRLTATFVTLDSIPPRPVTVERVIGWHAGTGVPAPTDALLVSVVVTRAAAAARTEFLAAADAGVSRRLEAEE